MSVLILIAVVLFHGHHISAELKLPDPCPLVNSTCMSQTIGTVANTIGRNGSEELNFASVEPYHLENIDYPVMDYMNLKLTEGQCLGIVDTCRSVNYSIDPVTLNRNVELSCKKIQIKFKYELTTNPNFCHILDAWGSGNASIILDEWIFKINHNFTVVKRDDGEIYLVPNFKKAIWESKVLTKVTFAADSIKIEGQEIAEEVTSFMNDHWSQIQDTFGKFFHELSMEYYFKDYALVFDKIPARKFFTDDLTPFIGHCG